MTLTDYMCQEKKEEEDLPALCGGRVITATRNNTENTRVNWSEIIRKQKWEEKQLYGRFKRLTSDVLYEKTCTWLRKGNFMRETESLLIATQQRHKHQSYQSENR